MSMHSPAHPSQSRMAAGILAALILSLPAAAFGKQLNDVELAAVITFTRNSWGNKTGDLVQPAEVKALRK